MTLYTSDVDIIYDGIRTGTIRASNIRILSSKNLQLSNLLSDFPNIEDILCNIICNYKELDKLASLISLRHKLKTVSLVVYIPESDIIQNQDKLPPSKKRRITQMTFYEKTLNNIIPNIIRKLGARMRYINFRIVVIDNDDTGYTEINLNNGVVFIKSNTLINYYTENIFHSMFEMSALKSIKTDGNTKYNLSKIDYIPEITIIAKMNIPECPIDISYLESLISKAEIVNIIYDSNTIDERYLYSDIIRRGTNGSLKQIRAIIPVIDVKTHIMLNKNLEEIHILVPNAIDVENIRDIINTYNYRPISYYIYYHQITDDQYWSCLANLGDVIFKNIVQSLILD
jgi:hypothetical protein